MPQYRIVATDGSHPPVQISSRDGAAALKYIPLEGAELEKINALVRQAVGFDTKRGDEISVSNFKFNVGGGVAPGRDGPGGGGVVHQHGDHPSLDRGGLTSVERQRR